MKLGRANIAIFILLRTVSQVSGVVCPPIVLHNSLSVKDGILRRADTDILDDILARIVARMSACRSACHILQEIARVGRVSEDPREDVGVGVGVVEFQLNKVIWEEAARRDAYTLHCATPGHAISQKIATSHGSPTYTSSLVPITRHTSTTGVSTRSKIHGRYQRSDGQTDRGRTRTRPVYTVSQKNDSDAAHYNFNAHQPILVIFGRDNC